MTTRPEPSPHSGGFAHHHRSNSSGDDSDSAPPSRHPGRASMSAAQHHLQELNPGSYSDQQYDGGSSSDGGPAAAQRGRMGSKAVRPASMRRADSGSIIVTGGEPVEGREEVYGSEDARTMSPRRSGEEVDRLGENARRALMRQAKELQDSLLEIVDRVESVKEEHEKLEGGNRFLQSYIGELMQTSKLTAAGAAGKGKGGRGRAAR